MLAPDRRTSRLVAPRPVGGLHYVIRQVRTNCRVIKEECGASEMFILQQIEVARCNQLVVSRSGWLAVKELRRVAGADDEIVIKRRVITVNKRASGENQTKSRGCGLSLVDFSAVTK